MMPIKLINRDYSLQFTRLRLADLGPYVCQAYSGAGKGISRTVTLKAYGPVSITDPVDEKYLRYIVHTRPPTAPTYRPRPVVTHEPPTHPTQLITHTPPPTLPPPPVHVPEPGKLQPLDLHCSARMPIVSNAECSHSQTKHIPNAIFRSAEQCQFRLEWNFQEAISMRRTVISPCAAQPTAIHSPR